jgi:pimeloyl-ACP methyl ester carboxylesterase
MTIHRTEDQAMNKLLAALAAVLSGAAIFLATRGQTFSRVDAGGPTLRMLMTGNGNPTVLFEAGAGGPLEAWVRIQPEVSKFARTISYDRAGNGLSKKGATPRDGRRIGTELHTALQNAHASPPYILVGHSLGGPYIRVFAGMYPDEVAGMVLVDPTQEELIAWAKAHDPKTPDEHKFRPYDEVDCASATFAQAQENPVPATIPVFLITGMGPRVIPGFLTKELQEEVRKDQKTLYPAKLKFHKAWVEKIPGGQLIITENSGHGIPFEEPELVINTIREAVNRARLPNVSREIDVHGH